MVCPLMSITNARLPVVMAFVMSISNMSQEHDFPVGHGSFWHFRHQIIKFFYMFPPYTRKKTLTTGRLGYTLRRKGLDQPKKEFRHASKDTETECKNQDEEP